MDPLQRAREVFAIEQEALEAVSRHLDASFARAVELLVRTLQNRSKIVVVGIGKSGNIGRKIIATLTSTGSTAVLLHSVDALHGDLGIINDGDVVLALSASGETEELVQLLPAIKSFDVRLIAMTGALDSTLARHCDIVLNVQVPREACPFNLAPTASTTAMLVMGDALAMAVLDARGFKQSDYAKHHPSGSIGRAMLIRLKDVMKSGDRNPVVKDSTTVKEALLTMTRAKAGLVSIVDDHGKLVGVFTDGDLRRHLAQEEAILSLPIQQVMTPDPIRLNEDSLAVESLKIFQQREIDDVVVVNDKDEPVGVIDSQDLPKLKLL